jgi:hypothetical protein
MRRQLVPTSQGKIAPVQATSMTYGSSSVGTASAIEAPLSETENDIKDTLDALDRCENLWMYMMPSHCASPWSFPF